MLSSAIVDGLNEQLNREFYSTYLYLAISSDFKEKDLYGFAHFFEKQANEEFEHVKKFIDYIELSGEKAKFDAISKPDFPTDSVVDVIETILNHEKSITTSINKLYEESVNEKDYGTEVFLQWFVNEQKEEENTFEVLLRRMKKFGTSNIGLTIIDQELSKRE